jgi:glucosamine 6-phosphate synthetase-like amidotransferase/phosphosugar isomerase protein
MCNIAGYIGKKQAAPILIEMMKKQEGFGGGYYTGITTQYEGKLHSTKVIGDTKNFLDETDGIHFSGTTGFIHSRSNSGGDAEWGHPFLSSDESVSYIANGSAGSYLTEDIKSRRNDTAVELEKKGYVFASKNPEAIGNYPVLPDNSSIHMSDLMCQYITHFIDSGTDTDQAMSKAFSELPSEVVGLILQSNIPDKIFVSRVNQPMMIGISDDGDTYLATTAIAFPEDVRFKTIELLPHSTTCEVYRGGYRVSTHPIQIHNVADITPYIWHHAYARIEELLKNKQDSPISVGDVINACIDIWPEEKVRQGAPLVYEILRSFKNEGRLGVTLVPAKGAFEGYETNNFRIYLVD